MLVGGMAIDVRAAIKNQELLFTDDFLSTKWICMIKQIWKNKKNKKICQNPNLTCWLT